MSNTYSKCRVCQLPEKIRKEVDYKLIRNTNVSDLALWLSNKGHDVSRDSLYRHKMNHLGGAVAEGGRRALQNHGSDLLQGMLDKMNDLTERTEDILNKAEGKDQIRNSLLAIQQLRNNYQMMGTIVTSMAQAGLGMDPELLEEFQRWKEGRGTVDLDLFSEEDKLLIREIAIQKLSSMGSIEDVEDFRSNSFIVQHHVPVEDVEEVLDRFEPDPDLEYRLDANGHSLKPMRTRPRPVEEDPAPGRTTPRNEDPDQPMRRTTPRG